MDDTGKTSLVAADYAVFGVLLGISAIIGIYFAYRDRNSKDGVNDYLLGGRKMTAIPTSISISLTFLSGTTVLGIPSEIMYFGATYCWLPVAVLISTTIGAEVFLPMYYKLGITSPYEYLSLRFNNVVRIFATLVFLIQTIMNTGILIYGPSLAINAVSNFPLWAAVLSIGIVCTVYTTLGGLKAVIWTDVVQGLVLVAVLLVVIFESASYVGGFDRVWKLCSEGDRLDFFHFDFDPRYRTTFWSISVGLCLMWTSIAATNQASAQRFLCCKSVGEGKKAMYFSFLNSSVLLAEIYIASFVTYAYFSDCDPLKNGDISAADQALPYMVLRILKNQPGLSGLFLAGLFAASLSSISSSINGLTCVTINDFIKPNVNWSGTAMLWVSKGLAVLFGVLCIGFAFLSSILGGILQAALSLLGMCAGPLLGPFVLGTLFPFSNSLGALLGMIAAFAMNVWLYIGSLQYPALPMYTRPKNTSIEGCPDLTGNYTNNSTSSWTISSSETTFGMTTSMSMQETEPRPPIAELYAVSFSYYTLIGLLVCVIVGLVASLISGGYKTRLEVDPRLIYFPLEHKWLRWLPEKFRKVFRVEVKQLEKSESGNIPVQNGKGTMQIKDSMKAGDVNHSYVMDEPYDEYESSTKL